MAWRYIAQRILTGEFLDWDVPLNREAVTWTLSGAGVLKGTVAPEIGTLRAPDGSLLLQEWGTALYAEKDGDIRWGGLVTHSAFSGAAWSVEASGFATYAFGLPFMGILSSTAIDPADVLRAIWEDIQRMPDGNLGLDVRGDDSPITLGKPSVAAYPEVFINNAWVPKSGVPTSQIDADSSTTLAKPMTSKSTSLVLTSISHFNDFPLPFDVKVGAETVTVRARNGLTFYNLVRGVGSTSPTSHAKGVKVTKNGTPTRTHDATDAEPYQLLWWETKDCGSEISTLVQSTPFDYVETHEWAEDGDDLEISHVLDYSYPRAGRRRTDLTFVMGENITNVIEAERDGTEFANEVIGIGAGEGAKSIHTRIPQRDGRLRRPTVYTDKSITTQARMDTLSRAVLATHRDVLEITSVEVMDHPHAPIGSWSLGDDVLIQAHLPWLGDVAIWSRITEWSLLSDDRAQLTLARSDSFA